MCRARTFLPQTLIFIYESFASLFSVLVRCVRLPSCLTFSDSTIKYKECNIYNCRNVLITWKVNIFQRNFAPIPDHFCTPHNSVGSAIDKIRTNKPTTTETTFNCQDLVIQWILDARIRSGRHFCCQYFIHKNALVQLLRFHFDSSLKRLFFVTLLFTAPNACYVSL